MHAYAEESGVPTTQTVRGIYHKGDRYYLFSYFFLDLYSMCTRWQTLGYWIDLKATVLCTTAPKLVGCLVAQGGTLWEGARGEVTRSSDVARRWQSLTQWQFFTRGAGFRCSDSLSTKDLADMGRMKRWTVKRLEIFHGEKESCSLQWRLKRKADLYV